MVNITSGSTGEFIFYAVFIFFALAIIITGLVMWIFWRRRKLIFTNFLSETGQWEKVSWMPNKITEDFTYDSEPYKYNIKRCTRDSLNRPIAHYFKGNPEQQIFDFSKGNKRIRIETREITGKDFSVLMLSKVLRDIFQDEEVMNMLMILLIVTIAGALINIGIAFLYNPSVSLKDGNETLRIIAQGVRMAIENKI
jgi:hypothetical protein